MGSRGDDVLELQKILNEDSDTRIAISGVGSPGFESSYFGTLTKNAVAKFQNKYASEILISGQTPTGFVGPNTRKKLNFLLSKKNISINPLPIPLPSANILASSSQSQATSYKPITSPISPIKDLRVTDKAMDNFRSELNSAISLAVSSRSKLKIDTSSLFAKVGGILLYYPSIHAGVSGTSVTINGKGFTPTGNSVYFGENYAIDNLASLDGSTLTFSVPNIPSGKYRMAFGNKNGLSNTTYFVVTTSDSPSVKVLSVFPETISVGDKVTVTGSGFSATDNVVYTSFGAVENLDSFDGKTLSFVFSPDVLKTAVSSGKRYNKLMKVPVFVLNNNGINTEPVFFNIKF